LWTWKLLCRKDLTKQFNIISIWIGEIFMKMCVLYFSKTGNTKKMAEDIARGMESVGEVQAKAMSIEDLDDEFVRESACVVVGTPTYYTSLAGQVKSWLDTESGRYSFAGKLGGAFSTAQFTHGGGEIAIQNILTHLQFLGMLIYSGGGAVCQPPIHLGPVAITDGNSSFTQLFETYGQRMATKAKEIF
jgi:NAD(P)H dehydrogenase (quinone)